MRATLRILYDLGIEVFFPLGIAALFWWDYVKHPYHEELWVPVSISVPALFELGIVSIPVVLWILGLGGLWISAVFVLTGSVIVLAWVSGVLRTGQ